jgi:hypothetical protein
MRCNFTISKDKYDQFVIECQMTLATSYCHCGGHPVASPEQNRNYLWKIIGKEMGFKWDTVQIVLGEEDRLTFSAEITE